MYTPPVGARRASSGITHCSEVSFDTKFSERKVPHGSEYSFISRQKVLSARRVGMRLETACCGRTAGCCAAAHPDPAAQQAATVSQWRASSAACLIES